MTLQWLAVALIVIAAAGVVARQTYRTWFRTKKSGCSSGCGTGCATPTATDTGTVSFVPVEQLTVRSRRD